MAGGRWQEQDVKDAIPRPCLLLLLTACCRCPLSAARCPPLASETELARKLNAPGVVSDAVVDATEDA